MSWEDGLAGPALDFAGATEPRLRSLAGPGTGKTFALMRRVWRLLEEGTEPGRILVVTLTRTAAQDLKKNLLGLGLEEAARVTACTLHSLCFSVLQRDEVLRATGRTPRILAGFESDILLRDLPDEFGSYRQKKRLLRNYLSAWAHLDGDPLGTPSGTLPRDFLRELLQTLTWHRCMLVGELVPIARAYLTQNPHAAVLEAFDHVLVDEYQDLNKADQEVIELLASTALQQERGQLAVVGDDDQAIYVILRNAYPSGIVEFVADRHVTFNECYRCPKRVVRIAQHLIEFNPDRARPPLEELPSRPDGVIHNVVFTSREQEAERLAKFIAHRVENDGVAPGDILVLANWREIAYAIRDELDGLGIPSHSYFQEQALDTVEAKEALLLLTLLGDPSDRVALRSWLALRGRAECRAPYRRIVSVAQHNGCGVSDILERMRSGDISVRRAASALEPWGQLQTALSALGAEANDIEGLIEKLIPSSKPELYLLREAAERAFRSINDEADLLRLSEAVRKQIGMPEVPLEADFVRLMSLHKSKGLRARIVVIAGLVEGLVPRKPPAELTEEEVQEHRQEQRRAFYVGITRATDELVLSKFQSAPYREARVSGMSLGRWGGRGRTRTIPSTFMNELGPELASAVRGDRWQYS